LERARAKREGGRRGRGKTPTQKARRAAWTKENAASRAPPSRGDAVASAGIAMVRVVRARPRQGARRDWKRRPKRRFCLSPLSSLLFARLDVRPWVLQCPGRAPCARAPPILTTVSRCCFIARAPREGAGFWAADNRRRNKSLSLSWCACFERGGLFLLRKRCAGAVCRTEGSECEVARGGRGGYSHKGR
jgi:hypothetical protein